MNKLKCFLVLSFCLSFSLSAETPLEAESLIDKVILFTNASGGLVSGRVNSYFENGQYKIISDQQSVYLKREDFAVEVSEIGALKKKQYVYFTVTREGHTKWRIGQVEALYENGWIKVDYQDDLGSFARFNKNDSYRINPHKKVYKKAADLEIVTNPWNYRTRTVVYIPIRNSGEKIVEFQKAYFISSGTDHIVLPIPQNFAWRREDMAQLAFAKYSTAQLYSRTENHSDYPKDTPIIMPATDPQKPTEGTVLSTYLNRADPKQYLIKISYLNTSEGNSYPVRMHGLRLPTEISRKVAPKAN